MCRLSGNSESLRLLNVWVSCLSWELNKLTCLNNEYRQVQHAVNLKVHIFSTCVFPPRVSISIFVTDVSMEAFLSATLMYICLNTAKPNYKTWVSLSKKCAFRTASRGWPFSIRTKLEALDERDKFNTTILSHKKIALFRIITTCFNPKRFGEKIKNHDKAGC